MKKSDSCEIKNKQNKVIGNCFKLNDKSNYFSEKERNIKNLNFDNNNNNNNNNYKNNNNNVNQLNYNNCSKICSLGLNQNFSQANKMKNPNPNLVPHLHNYNDFDFFQFNNPPLIGLENIGSTCYMNATLQCLSQIEPLVKYFKTNKHVIDTIIKYKQSNKDCLTESFKILIDNLWPKNNNNLSKNNNNYYYVPYDFKNKISKMNSLFQGIQANDPKDLLFFIMQTLHEELNKKQNKNYYYDLGDTKNEQNALFYFMEYFIRDNKSFISDLFFGVYHTMTKCSKCPFYNHDYGAYSFLIFPLEEVRKNKLKEIIEINKNLMKMDMNTIDMYKIQVNLKKIKLILQNNSVDILDCFDYYQKIENFIGENAMYCQTCRAPSPATNQTKLYFGPNILILVLSRGKGEFNVKLQFGLKLDLTDYCENKISGCIYDLIGVITHLGKRGECGHFIASCKSPVNNEWYQYNDRIVSPTNDFNKEILNFGNPYILFYKKIE